MVVTLGGRGGRKLSIALVAPFPPPYGGMGVRFEQMAQCLEKKGVCVEKVCLDAADGFLPRFLVFFQSSIQILKLRAVILHVVTGSIPNFIALTPVLLAAKISGRTIVLSIGGGYWERESVLNSFRSKTVRMLLRLPDVIIACNKELIRAMTLLGVAPDNLEYISNALPDEYGSLCSIPVPNEFSSIRKNRSVVLLYVGAMKPWYGLLETLDMLAGLRENGFDAVLVALVKEGGDKGFSSILAERAESLSIREYFHTFISVPWAVSAMAQSDAIIRATNTIEGDSRAVREALAIGVPVIASDIGHRPDGVILFKAGDASSMQKVVENTLSLSSKKITTSDNTEGKENIRRILEIYRQLQDKLKTI